MLAVRDLVRDLELELIAGDEAADAPIRWIHISELADPTPWLSGGELLLTTGMGLTDPAEQEAFVDRLADRGLAGLGFGVGFSHDAVPAAMVEAARRRRLPLVSVPYELPFLAITERAFAQLVNEQYAVLRRSISALERLQAIVLSERGLEAIAAALSALVGGSALVFDGRGELLAGASFRRALEPEARAAIATGLHERARTREAHAHAPAAPELAGSALALPVPAAGERPAGGPPPLPQAWLVAVKDQGGLSEQDRLVLHQAVTVVALELLRRRVADTTQRRLAGDVLNQAIAGRLEGAELAARLQPFGLEEHVAAVVLGPPAAGQAGERALDAALRAESVAGLVARAGGLACALVPGLPDDELFELGERVRRRASAALGRPVPAGAGRAVPAGQVRRAFHEARCALEARGLAAGEPPAGNGNGNGARHPEPTLATFRDLGSFQLLLSLQDEEALRLFCDSMLGPIERGEGQYGGELLRSLEAFIECNGQWESAARRLYCHRHTLRYRIRRIEELTGRDLSSARDRIEFWLALRGRELIARPEPV